MGEYKRGEYLNNLIKKRGISQEQLGKIVGLSRQSVNEYIKKNSYYKIDDYIIMSREFDVSLDDLIFGGKKRTTKLRRFAMKLLDKMKIEKLPNQPDGLGKYLIDYVIELDDLEKFNFYLKEDVYQIPLHNHIGLLKFLVRHNQHELLRKGIRNTIVDPKSKNNYLLNRSFEFPVLDFVQSPGKHFFERSNHQYNSLNTYQKEFVDVILDTNSNDILDLLPYAPKANVNDYHSLFYWAIKTNKVFVVKYYIDKKNDYITQSYFDTAIHENAWTVAKYFFENMELKTLANLKKIKDTKYKKVWTNKLNDIDS
ncbi:MAG: helix-turn-helix transcriptional regulator [Tenericutes bacterium]|nr:helix-turn-helix transcriptional regulator [Mycoplasmatota bacterium]